MRFALVLPLCFFATLNGLGRHCSLLKALPYNLLSQRRGMRQVVGIEAVIAQLVHNYFVCRKITTSNLGD